jgi:Na+/H+ antiporter NhaD/arsenite permease-like protein
MIYIHNIIDSSIWSADRIFEWLKREMTTIKGKDLKFLFFIIVFLFPLSHIMGIFLLCDISFHEKEKCECE